MIAARQETAATPIRAITTMKRLEILAMVGKTRLNRIPPVLPLHLPRVYVML